MLSDNSDTDDSLSDFQLTDNIKQQEEEPSIKLDSSTNSEEQHNTSNNKSAASDLSTSSSRSSVEHSTSISKSPEFNGSTSSSRSSVEHNTSISKSPAKNISTKNSSSLPLNLQHYLSNYENCFVPQAGAANALDKIESDEEVFIVQASKDFNLKEFVDNKLSIDKTNTFETSDGITLECYMENFSTKPNLTLIYGDKKDSAMKVNTFVPEGKLVIREKLYTGKNEGSDIHLKVESPKKVPFPRDLKVRHPLVGAFYEDKINLSKKIVKRLQSSKKTKKIKKEHSVENVTIKMEQSEHVEPVKETPIKKHKKSAKLKRERSVELDDELDNVEKSIIKHSPKKKKIKLEKFDDENDLSWLSQI